MDLFTKVLLEESGRELATWLTGKVPLEARPVTTELAQAEARMADHILRVVLPGKAPELHYLHVEIQTRGDRQMGLRMLDYWTRATRLFSKREGRPVPVSSFVVYLDRGQYSTDRGLIVRRGGFGTGCRFRYSVLKLWEMDPRSVLDLPGPALAPFAPLMQAPDPVPIVLESKQRILEADPRIVSRRTKADLCSALAALSGLVIRDWELVKRLIWEDWMDFLEKSVVVQEWLRMGREEGLRKGIEKGMEKGIERGIQKSLLTVLRSRFGKVGKRLEARVLAIGDEKLLQRLIRRAAVVSSLGEFSREVES